MIQKSNKPIKSIFDKKLEAKDHAFKKEIMDELDDYIEELKLRIRTGAEPEAFQKDKKLLKGLEVGKSIIGSSWEAFAEDRDIPIFE